MNFILGEEIPSDEELDASDLNNDGVLKAYNTDFLAARKFLQNYDYKLYFSNTYVLGNGGYASAVKAAMKHYEIEPIVITRDNLLILHSFCI